MELSSREPGHLHAAVLMRMERSIVARVRQVLKEKGPPSDPEAPPDSKDPRDPKEPGPPDPKTSSPIDKLLEHFSVEKTAQRIFNFIEKGFGKTSFGKTDTPESRRSFTEFILPYVQRGADEALAMFGELPDEATQKAKDTISKVGDLLTAFVG